MSYAKLFSTITESSLWSTSKETRLLFVSMLARANAVGLVEASIPGLARMSNLTRRETEKALRELMAPDRDDKSGNNEGRRLVKVDGGWCIVNYEIYRNRRDEEERRAYMREYMAQYRKRPVNNVNSGKPPLAQAEGEAAPEAKEEGEREKAPSPVMGDAEKKKREWLLKRGVLLQIGGQDIFGEWDEILARMDDKEFTRILKNAVVPIKLPSEFRAACK